MILTYLQVLFISACHKALDGFFLAAGAILAYKFFL